MSRLRKLSKLTIATVLLCGLSTTTLYYSPQIVEAKSSHSTHRASRSSRTSTTPRNHTSQNTRNTTRSNSGYRSYRSSTTNKRNYTTRTTKEIINSTTSAYTGFKSNSTYKQLTDYTYNPYMNNNHYFINYYLYAILWSNTHTDMLKNEGIDQNKLLHPIEPTYWVTITRENKAELKVLVTKSQYDKIQNGDNIKVVNKKLYVNNTELLK